MEMASSTCFRDTPCSKSVLFWITISLEIFQHLNLSNITVKSFTFELQLQQKQMVHYKMGDTLVASIVSKIYIADVP